MVTDIENELQKLARAEVESRIIGEMAMERLRALDRVAYIRFASVYRDFQDEDEFARAIESLQVDEQAEEEKSQLPLIPDVVPRLADRGRKTRRTRVR